MKKTIMAIVAMAAGMTFAATERPTVQEVFKDIKNAEFDTVKIVYAPEKVFWNMEVEGDGDSEVFDVTASGYWMARANDDWLMVTQSSYLSNVACYVRRQDLASRYTHGLAVVVSKNAEDCLNLRSEPRDDARVLGKYYAGTVVAVHDTQNGFDIYRNENHLPMGFSYTQFMTESEFEKIGGGFQRQILLCTYLVVPDDMASPSLPSARVAIMSARNCLPLCGSPERRPVS